MNTYLKQISTSLISFKELIKQDLVYVDKTGMLLELIKGSENAVFLSRPRRFGKSLVLKTIAEIFSGDRSLFKGLQIEKSGYDFPQHPVLRLDMSIVSSSPQKLERAILNRLKFLAEQAKLTIKLSDFENALIQLITGLRDKYKKNVVVLIDEYDCPLSSVPPNTPLSKAFLQVLSSFYMSLKTVNELIRFAFVTGVTRYSMVGISAGLNNLYDISLVQKYAAICGFTPEEMDLYFGDRYPIVLQSIKENDYPPTVDEQAHLSTVADLKAEILKWYDGYSWDGQTNVLNPISILYFFKEQSFGQYWKLNSPSTHFLLNMFQDNASELTFDKLEDVPLRDITSLIPGQITPASLLFQTGYLTVDKINIRNKITYYNFKVPNSELSGEFYNGLSEALFKILVKDSDKAMKALELKEALMKRDAESLTNIIGALYAELPAVLHPDKEYRRKESFYHSLFWAYSRGLLMSSMPEEQGYMGNPDLTLRLNQETYAIIEMKYERLDDKKKSDTVLNSKANEALKFIHDKNYGEQLRRQGLKVIAVGVGIYGRGEVKAIFDQDS
ncbi:MAG: ATP-binding protein [Deltaproteobacteria bacterium]|jgi:hypothetical protein|nr:ATP-binding protein [Deltaproteobacteria bacterium]